MAVFRYIATELSTGQSRRGELAADSAHQVRATLARMGLLPSRVAEVSAPATRDRTNGLVPGRLTALITMVSRRRRSGRLVELYEGLSAMLAAGVPIAESLDAMASVSTNHGRGRMRSRGGAANAASVARLLADGLRGGGNVADGMAALPEWFGPIDIALVRAALESGSLERTLLELADSHGLGEELRTRLAAVLAYPALLAAFGTGVVVFLTTTTLPQLAAVLSDAGVEVPGATRVLLATGQAITSQPLVAIGTGIAAIGAFGWLSVTPLLARRRLQVPLLGSILMRGQMGAACVLLSRLLRGGIPLAEAIPLACTAVPNSALRAALTGIVEQLRQGRGAGDALDDAGLFEPVLRQVLRVGEESGELPTALETIGTRYARSARRLMDRLAGALEPVVILALAAAVGFVVYGAIAPMLRLTQTIR